MLTSQAITFRCECLADVGRPCPVRFRWVGPAREKHSQDDERRDERAALDAAERFGFRFGPTSIACPRHAKETPGG